MTAGGTRDGGTSLLRSEYMMLSVWFRVPRGGVAAFHDREHPAPISKESS